jgi:hypothetical protein
MATPIREPAKLHLVSPKPPRSPISCISQTWPDSSASPHRLPRLPEPQSHLILLPSSQLPYILVAQSATRLRPWALSTLEQCLWVTFSRPGSQVSCGFPQHSEEGHRSLVLGPRGSAWSPHYRIGAQQKGTKC